jgi:uncharacterized protein (DUF983 family)
MSEVNCPRCNEKTDGKLYRAENTTANVCESCSRELEAIPLKVKRVR